MKNHFLIFDDILTIHFSYSVMVQLVKICEGIEASLPPVNFLYFKDFGINILNCRISNFRYQSKIVVFGVKLFGQKLQEIAIV